jgi:hypothetical protein
MLLEWGAPKDNCNKLRKFFSIVLTSKHRGKIATQYFKNS